MPRGVLFNECQSSAPSNFCKHMNMPRGVGPTTRPAMIPRSDIILKNDFAGLQNGSRVGHEAKPLKQYTFIRSSYFVVGLCIATVSGPLRVSSRATVTGH